MVNAITKEAKFQMVWDLLRSYDIQLQNQKVYSKAPKNIK